jgi:hypothetical protein
MNQNLDQIVSSVQTLFVRNERISMLSLGMALISALIGMSLLSLTMLNSKSTNGYQLNQLQSVRVELTEDMEITEMLNLRAMSLDSVMKSEVVMNMTEPGREQVTYVSPLSATYAEVGW